MKDDDYGGWLAEKIDEERAKARSHPASKRFHETRAAAFEEALAGWTNPDD